MTQRPPTATSRPCRATAARSRSQDLLAGVLDRAAVEVGARARGRGRGVGHLVGARRRQPHPLQRHAERGGGDLEHLGVQALAHLGAAVVDQHRAVLVDVHERAGLVEGREVERDAELHRRHRQRRACVCGCAALNAAISARRGATSAGRSSTWSQAAASRSGCRTGWPYGVAWPVDVEVAAAQLGRVDARAAARSGRGCPR